MFGLGKWKKEDRVLEMGGQRFKPKGAWVMGWEKIRSNAGSVFGLVLEKLSLALNGQA